jgi:ATP-dependent Lon protease
MEIIELPGYTPHEKLQIAERHLIPRQIEAHGLKRKQIKLPTPTLERVIADYTREAGVRNLEREIANLCRKVARRVAEGKGAGVTIEAKQLPTLLGPVRFESEVAEQRPTPGVVTGLAWTPTGGDILFIEATRMPGKGNLILTGSLGDVMKESARAALSYLRSHAADWKIDPKFADDSDLHIHIPAGAIPKDGPSAGLAMLAALFSLASGQAVPPQTAMTGEITLRGRIMPVGGIKEKVLAAARAGITCIILPSKNRRHLTDVPPEIRKKLTFKFVDRAEDAIRLFSQVARKAKP